MCLALYVRQRGCLLQRKIAHWVQRDTSLFAFFCSKLFSAETFSVCVCACKHTAFCAKRPFQTVSLGQQLSNLTDCLPDMFCLFFPSKLKFKEKEREVHFPSRLNLSMLVIRNNSVLIFLSLSLYFIREICLSLPVKVSSP